MGKTNELSDPISLRLPMDVLTAIEQVATATDRTRSWVIVRALKRYLNRRELDIDWETAESAPLESLVTSLAMGLPFDPAEKQALLEAPTMTERCEALTALLEIDGLGADDDGPQSIQ